jgi:putative transposase
MAGTYSQIYVQYVIVVNGRQNLLGSEWRHDVFKYISGIITNKGQKAIIINGVGNHVHIFVGLKPSMKISDLARDIKNNSSNYINKNKWVKGKFSWQEGYWVFSYAQTQVESVYNYILNQEEHHKKHTFKEEYYKFLNEFNVNYEDQYLFDWLD